MPTHISIAGDMMLAKDNAFFTQPATVKFPAMTSNLAFKVGTFRFHNPILFKFEQN